jgi:hypothetical protein
MKHYGIMSGLFLMIGIMAAHIQVATAQESTANPYLAQNNWKTAYSHCGNTQECRTQGKFLTHVTTGMKVNNNWETTFAHCTNVAECRMQGWNLFTTNQFPTTDYTAIRQYPSKGWTLDAQSGGYKPNHPTNPH